MPEYQPTSAADDVEHVRDGVTHPNVALSLVKVFGIAADFGGILRSLSR